MEKPLRNNTRADVRIPSFANLVINDKGIYLTVTFPTKEKYIPFFKEEHNECHQIYAFSRFGKHYITATRLMSFENISDIGKAVYTHCYKMRDDLKNVASSNTESLKPL